ncbi:helix-turn-helix transcriptional regulator [Mucilaginibacter gynuensis]|uniref:Helix-turn-helix transcriptional regulator n=1 Tax=Mucilaginibacter gynuensis TaxID=1302236 RepID=A0ABP8H7W8_9SPHI
MNTISSISDFHRLLNLPSPSHPLVSVIRLEEATFIKDDVWQHFFATFYCVALKREVQSRMKYGQNYYDFDKGVMSFTAPKQVQSLDPALIEKSNGYVLAFHHDFMVRHPLANTIKSYGFFSYAVNEALHLSEKEEEDMIMILEKISREYQHIDRHTQTIILSQIDLLLSYSNRFYERQFITRKKVNTDLLVKFEAVVADYFDRNKSQEHGLLTVQYLADQLNLSPNYLSDMLRVHTGQSTQQHLQTMLIEKAKELLLTTSMSVSEIAYLLGFEYPQSFNKLFKTKTQYSPLQFRHSYN